MKGAYLMVNDPIERLRYELTRPPLFSERNGYEPLNREPLINILDEIEAQYMKLPIDADGVPIRIYDEVRTEFDKTIEVVAVDEARCFYYDNGDYYYAWASDVNHVKPDALYDLLEEYSDAILQCTCPDYEGDNKPGALREEYAKKIREVVANG